MDPTTALALLSAERSRLEHLREALHHDGYRTTSASEATSEIAPGGQHPADVGTETFESEVGQSVLSDVEIELALLDRAVERVRAGTYGICAACHEPIPDERLEAVPATDFCLRHEEAAEFAGASTAVVMRGHQLTSEFLATDDRDVTEETSEETSEESAEQQAMHRDPRS